MRVSVTRLSGFAAAVVTATFVACGSSRTAPGLSLGSEGAGDDDASTAGDDSGHLSTTDGAGGSEPSDASAGASEASDAIAYPPFDTSLVKTRQVYADTCDSYVISRAGELEAWGCYAYRVPAPIVGKNPDGGVDTPIDPDSPTPEPVVDGGAGASWTDIGGECGVRSDHSLWCWGTYGLSKFVQNGGAVPGGFGGDDYDGSVIADAPGPLAGSWVAVVTTISVACGIQTNGSGWCWGSNVEGVRGIGQAPSNVGMSNYYTPQLLDVANGTQWRTLSAGNNDVCGVQVDGTLWCWGSNEGGQIGLDVGGYLDKPTKVSSNATWDGVAAGVDETCASRGQDLYCWGGTTATGEVPPAPSDLPYGAILFAHTTTSGWSKLSSSSLGTCAVDASGALFCAEGTENNNGRPGVGAQVMTAYTWSDVAVEGVHACGLTTRGLVRCWGENEEGALGPNGGPIQHQAEPTTMTGSIPNAVDVGTF